MVAIGIKTSNEAYRTAAKAIGITELNYSATSNSPVQEQASLASMSAVEKSKDIELKADSHNKKTNTVVVDQAVRSGKQIYAKDADLIINSSVSHGAEVLADGNIHIYGTLNGRALAGVQGNTEARIYCKSLNAELIAIAGNYLVSEQIPEQYKDLSHMVSVSLDGQNLDFRKL